MTDLDDEFFTIVLQTYLDSKKRKGFKAIDVHLKLQVLERVSPGLDRSCPICPSST